MLQNSISSSSKYYLSTVLAIPTWSFLVEKEVYNLGHSGTQDWWSDKDPWSLSDRDSWSEIDQFIWLVIIWQGPESSEGGDGRHLPFIPQS